MFGTHDNAFQQLTQLMVAILHYNSDTIYHYEWNRIPTEGGAIFGKWLWAYEPLTEGFPYCHPLIRTDDTFARK